MASCTSISSLLWALPLAALILLLHPVDPRKLPAILPKCSAKLTVPELEKCVLDAARVSIPKIIHGAEGLHLPDLDPITVPEIRIQTGTSASNLDMTVKNIVLRGLADINILDVGMHTQGLYSVTCSIPRIEIVSDYVVDGKVLVLPIKGNGKANLTLENAYMYYQQPYSVERKNGHDYFKFPPSNAKFNCTRAYFNLENIFNGDKTLAAILPKCSAKLPIPELEKCLVKAGRESIPKIIHGAEGLHLPDMDPLTVPEIRIRTGTSASNLDMTAKNIVLRGLVDTNLLEIGMRPEGHYSVICNIPRLEIMGDYVVDGKVLVLPIKGSGKANLTFENAFMHVQQPYSLERKNGHDYFKFPPNIAKFNCTRAHFNLENLFNGDKKLGDTVNSFLNENWREVVDDLGQPFVDAAAAVIRQFTLGVVGNVPFDEIFDDAELPK